MTSLDEQAARELRRIRQGQEILDERKGSGNGAAPGDETGVRNIPTATVTEVLQVFQKWLYLPDEGSVYVPLGAGREPHGR